MESPPPFPAPSAPERSFAVNFGVGVAGKFNVELDRHGELRVRDVEPRFLFIGHPRQAFGINPNRIELPLHSQQVRNVVRESAVVQFLTTAGQSGAKRAPFIFGCANDEDAAAIVALLPKTKDTEFAAAEDFRSRLRALPGGGDGFGSLTNLIILANAAVFVVMGFCGAGWFEVASMTPYIRFGANNGAATTDGEWWRLITNVFFHYGLVHLLLNAWALFQSGALVEKIYGRSLYALIYLGSGVIGGFATLFWKGDRVWSAGASGAVFGVYGALISFLVRERKNVPAAIFQPMLISAVVFACYNLLYGAANPRIDNAAHIGGLLAGGLLGWCCALPFDREQRDILRPSRLRRAFGIVATAIVVGVAFAPRFDYRVRDGLGWAELVKPFVQQEQVLVEAEKAALTAYLKIPNPAALTRWLNTEAIPFYEQWLNRFATLELTGSPATQRRRQDLHELVQIKLEAFRRLAIETASKDPAALPHYHAAQRTITERAKLKK